MPSRKLYSWRIVYWLTKICSSVKLGSVLSWEILFSSARVKMSNFSYAWGSVLHLEFSCKWMDINLSIYTTYIRILLLIVILLRKICSILIYFMSYATGNLWCSYMTCLHIEEILHFSFAVNNKLHYHGYNPLLAFTLIITLMHILDLFWQLARIPILLCM